jgi:hypothetical protein
MQCRCGKTMRAVAPGVFLCGCGKTQEVGISNEWIEDDWVARMDGKICGLKEWILVFFQQRQSPF